METLESYESHSVKSTCLSVLLKLINQAGGSKPDVLGSMQTLRNKTHVNQTNNSCAEFAPLLFRGPSAAQGTKTMKSIKAMLAILCLSALSSQSYAADKQEAESVTDVLVIRAPKSVADLWKSWNGKYTLYVHRCAGFKAFKEFDGKSITCVLNGSPEQNAIGESIICDLEALQTAGGIGKRVSIQNNPEFYVKQLLEESANIGFMATGVAKHYELKKEKKLVEVVFVEAKPPSAPRSLKIGAVIAH